MLLIPTEKLLGKGNTYEYFANNYLHDVQVSEAVISAGLQQVMLKQLDAQVPNEQFYAIVDVRTGNLLQSNGIAKWLGYDEKAFSQKAHRNMVYPTHAIVQSYFASALFDMLIADKLEMVFGKMISTAVLGIKTRQGSFVYCKRDSFPFQISSGNKLLEYVDLYTIIKDFANEGYDARLLQPSNQLDIHNQQLASSIKKKFESSSGFSTQELRILKRYAQNEGITSVGIGKAFRIEKATVGTYNKRIMKKAEEIFEQRFANARQAADYFRNAKLI